MPAALREHLPDGPLRDVEEPRQVHRQHFGEVGLGVLGERLGDENPGVVDQRIDPAELPDRVPDHPVGDRRVGDVASDSEYVRRSVQLDGPGVGDDAVAAIEIATDQTRADPLRRPGDDGDLAFSTHDEPPE